MIRPHLPYVELPYNQQRLVSPQHHDNTLIVLQTGIQNVWGVGLPLFYNSDTGP